MTNPSVSTREVLQALGFAEDQSEQQRGFSFNFGNFKLWALPCTNRWFTPVVLVTGTVFDGSNLREVIQELPDKVESVEQAMAWMAWLVDKATTHPFNLSSEPGWLVQGRLHRHLLPWERERAIREKERAAYAARPHCDVQRDWVRLALKKLHQQLASVSPDATVTVSFDGTVLTMRCEKTVIAVSANGSPWTQKYEIRAGALEPLPKRLMRDPVDVSVWNSTLMIGNQRYAGVVPVEINEDTK
ncbi:MAG TPA: hypothetical protein VGQ52_06180 [Gemmatimonadaceae bacterium]|jgi:hypothetical protein|nr:hypothetical protein [Gemmatimonadaceae bacterium]